MTDLVTDKHDEAPGVSAWIASDLKTTIRIRDRSSEPETVNDDRWPGTVDLDTGIGIDIDLVRQLAELLYSISLTKIEVSHGDRRIRIVRKALQTDDGIADAETMAYPISPAVVATHDPTLPNPPLTIRSPLVGTAHLADRYDTAPFTSVGGKVVAGDTLLVVEVMKIKTPIIAPHDGVIIAVQVKDGGPVEFDQPLVDIQVLCSVGA